MGYVLARLQVSYGNENLERFSRSLDVISRLMAEEGIILRYAMVTQIGRLYEVWDLWEVHDAAHMGRGRAALRGKPDYHEAHVVLAEVVEEEELRYLEDVPRVSIPMSGSTGR
ncbi:hypothetical protein BH09ACT6_BH09ACT6_05470 [soil metagenome]